MSDFKAKMHQIRFCRWGSAPDPAGGAYSAPQTPLAVFKGPTSKGKEGRGNETGRGRGRGRDGVRRAPISCWHRAPRRVNPTLDLGECCNTKLITACTVVEAVV